MKAYIIGAGGVGSWMAPAMILLIGKDNVVIVDGDKLEAKNLNRQLFDAADINRNKAEALAARYGCQHHPGWYSFGCMSHAESDVLMVCVDNNPARAAALQACDFEGCSAILAANETLSSDARIYRPEWKDTPLDPRQQSPEIMADRTGDPRAAAIGCTGEAQAENRQLVTANGMAAMLALHLFVMHFMEELEPEAANYLPNKLVVNASKLEYTRICEVSKSNERTEQ